MESDIDNLRTRLIGLSGSQLEDVDVMSLLSEVLGGGGGVSVEVDQARFKLIRRDGKFVLTKDPARVRNSSLPPRR
jgi:hypothetical protein